MPYHPVVPDNRLTVSQCQMGVVISGLIQTYEATDYDNAQSVSSLGVVQDPDRSPLILK